MIKRGEVFSLEEDDGYHCYPKGNFLALRDITVSVVRELAADLKIADDLADRLVSGGYAEKFTTASIVYDGERVKIVGDWSEHDQ